MLWDSRLRDAGEHCCLWLAGLLGACATTDTKVSCEGKLQPINPSTAAKSAMLSKASGQPASGVSP